MDCRLIIHWTVAAVLFASCGYCGTRQPVDCTDAPCVHFADAGVCEWTRPVCCDGSTPACGWQLFDVMDGFDAGACTPVQRSGCASVLRVEEKVKGRFTRHPSRP